RLLGPEALELPAGEGAGRAFARVCVPRPEEPQARVPPSLDPANQRRGAAERALVQPVHRRLPQGGDRPGSQGPGRSCGFRPGRLRRSRRAGEVGARELSARRTVFLDQAASTGARSPLYAELCRRFADEPLVDRLVGPDPAWDAPLRLLGGLHALVLSGRASWDEVDL